MIGYGTRLAGLVAERGPLCVGIDPHPSVLGQWGLPVEARGLETCARTMVDALADLVPVMKPQSAFFEMHGSAGIAVLERVLADLRAAGALSLLDVKRGDIGSTMHAYAAAYLADGAPLAADAITISPYLGFGSLAPALDLAAQTGRGVYVLALTSNPEGSQVQHARAASGRLVAEEIVAAAAAANAGQTHGHVGLVVGATIGRTGVRLDQVHGSLLAPGIGAQGGGASGLAEVFGDALDYVLPAASREVMRAGPDPVRLRGQAERILGQMRSMLPVR
ncbi:MAG: orotidine-5'-phosphate decarboxylase [Microlunatus sp.]|nr:orotidine-5'-phosphate decarboxylase [Microlunatus sp.]MDN5770269.1 orotidine-5'-phosphate decarboxylase [Microlunatus sp.]MDN5803964.1 orotidine-5'-phosphate decarboxylase [Microlunatus sp.]